MKRAFEQVTEFHSAMDVHVGTPDAINTLHNVRLRLDLIDEEYSELVDALDDRDDVAVADALADLIYVVVGAAVTWGVPLPEVFDEVHRSNMAKVGGPVRADGKRLKPPGWAPPDIAGVLSRARGQK